MKQQCKFSYVNVVDISRRPPVSVSLGCHVNNLALPHPDPQDPYSMLAGVCKRAATLPPVIDSLLLARLKCFVSNFVKKNFVPLSADTDLSVETWLSHTAYPQWRKDELLMAWNDCSGKPFGSLESVKVKCFMKDEKYTEYKYPRGIYARHDLMKCYFGPVFKAIEDVVYKHPAFIKHIAVEDRPAYILKYLRRKGVIIATDYTAFESLFVTQLMEACEFVLYDFMVQNLPNGAEIMQKIRRILGGLNHCEFKHFWFRILATRMSGEMNTSLGNGFSNLMFMLFACACFESEAVGVVEGDDGLFVVSGPIPTSDFFSKLGLKIKLEVCDSLSSASFCGIIFDVDDCINIRDPIKVLLSFGWCTANYVNCKESKFRALLRCKALSLVHQYNGCPILTSLGLYALRMTEGVTLYSMIKLLNSKFTGSYVREQTMPYLFKKLPVIKAPGIKTRILMEEVFKIPISIQMLIESELNSKNSLCPIDDILIRDYVNKDIIDYSSRFLLEQHSDVYYPPIPVRDRFELTEVEMVINSASGVRLRLRKRSR